ncbi:MAG: hypothetical protein AAGD96_00960 [Chloroflexota bacterium]
MNIFRLNRSKLSRYLLLSGLIIGLVFAVSVFRASAQSGNPYITIDAVVRNQTVTVSGFQFPPNQTFTVRMGAYGTRGVGGAESATQVNSGNGSFQTDIAIPAGVQDLGVIAIRLDNSSSYFAFNWFFNNSTGVPAVEDEPDREVNSNVGGSNAAADYSGTPSLEFVKIEGEDVTVNAINLPPNRTFNVSMGSRGNNGFGNVVGSIQTGDGGDQEVTFRIPSRISHYGYIRIRIDSGGYSAFDGFFNPLPLSEPVSAADRNRLGNMGSSTPAYTGVPSIEFVNIDGEDVTIKMVNFPPDRTFNVSMGSRGTNGFGHVVGTLESGDGADKEATFTIPARISHYGYIRIRVDSGGYSAYASFFNPSPIPVARDNDGTVMGNQGSTDENSVLWLGNPSMKICVVEAGSKVTIETTNLPTNLTYKVRMNNMGTLGINGYDAGELQTENGATVRETIDIPNQLANNGRIAIRVESGIYNAYSWFYNSNASLC